MHPRSPISRQVEGFFVPFCVILQRKSENCGIIKAHCNLLQTNCKLKYFNKYGENDYLCKMKSNITFILLLVFVLLPVSCGKKGKTPTSFSLEGAWTLTQVESPMGDIDSYPQDGSTQLCVYEGDSMLYLSALTQTESALVVYPLDKRSITLIDKGGGELLYLEDGDPRPLTVSSDSTIVIQRNGVLYTYVRANDLSEEWGEDIRNIIASEQENNEISRYVLSSKEREQASVIHWLVYAIIAFVIIVLAIALIAIANHRAKQRLQLQLKQIKEEHDERPQPVRQAMASVESAFFASDEYHMLQQRMVSGQRLKEEDWNAIETQLKTVYPGFTSQLRNLYPMSELEYQTCLLIKLHIAPSDIATVLARDVSTISTVRSRLYKKVFGQKGGSKEWDEFLLSIGA